MIIAPDEIRGNEMAVPFSPSKQKFILNDLMPAWGGGQGEGSEICEQLKNLAI
jgi:hypothetical protein